LLLLDENVAGFVLPGRFMTPFGISCTLPS